MKTVIERLVAMRDELDDLINQLGTEESHCILHKQKGRPKSVIFHERVDTDRLAQCIRNIHQNHFNKTSMLMEVEGKLYGETDFMLCIYCALVKIGFAPSLKHNQINKQYYSFLRNQCRITLTEKERTFSNHLNKVVRTGCDLHRLNQEILLRTPSIGAMKAEELEKWQQMLSDAERLLLMDEYVISLANK